MKAAAFHFVGLTKQSSPHRPPAFLELNLYTENWLKTIRTISSKDSLYSTGEIQPIIL